MLVFPSKLGMVQHWLPRQAVTSVVTKQPAGVALVCKEAVRKLVRTDTKGAWLGKQATVNKPVNKECCW